MFTMLDKKQTTQVSGGDTTHKMLEKMEREKNSNQSAVYQTQEQQRITYKWSVASFAH